jgi:hypoxanthine phosphoribosyltransferase
VPPRRPTKTQSKALVKAAIRVPSKTPIQVPTKAPLKSQIKAPARVPFNVPIKGMAAAARETMHVDWPLFGELSRALALKVSREFDPEVVVGVATAGVVPGAVVAAMLDRPFHSIIVSRRYRAAEVRETPAVLSAAPNEVNGKRVLIVDETCNAGDTMRLAKAAIVNAGAVEVRTAVSFKTGSYKPDFYALKTESTIVLPWDREQIVEGELYPNPKYAVEGGGY